MVSESVYFFFIIILLLTFGCFYALKMQNINIRQPTLQKLYPHMTPKTHKISSFRVTWFITYRPHDTYTLLFFDFKYEDAPPYEILCVLGVICYKSSDPKWY